MENYNFTFKENQLLENPSYMTIYEFEKFDFYYWRKGLGQHWYISLYILAAYISLVFLGKNYMRNRKPLELRGILGLWNIGLALFSLCAFVRTFPEHLVVLKQPNGLHNSVCSRDGLTYAFAFWAWMGTWSKVVELGDTAFIILRKQRLIFLHWYHHASVLLYTFYTYDAHDPVHRWFMTMNSLIHAIMYSYYAGKCFGINLPRHFVMLITSLQIAQMIVGITVNSYSLVAKSNGVQCEREDKNIKLALTMYATYLLLFADFFYKTYFKKMKRT